MALSQGQLSKSRPVLYHLTNAQNLSSIRDRRVIYSANYLLKQAGRDDLCRVRRRNHEAINWGGTATLIRDQAPLHRGNVSLPAGWSFEELIHYLNQHVFFWPGTFVSPISYGVRHFERYKHEDNAIIRIRTEDLFEANTQKEMLLSRYNSGAPRCVMGKGSPRGPNTFRPLDDWMESASKIVEITFRTNVALPDSAEVANSLDGKWAPLFRSA